MKAGAERKLEMQDAARSEEVQAGQVDAFEPGRFAVARSALKPIDRPRGPMLSTPDAWSARIQQLGANLTPKQVAVHRTNGYGR